MFRKSIIIHLLILIPVITAFAQNTEDVLLQQLIYAESGTSFDNSIFNNSKILIDQVGSGNIVSVNQKDAQNNVNGSEAYIYQGGLKNSVNLNQTGSDNSTNIEQHGANNSIDFDLTGSNNKTLLMQSGSYNELISEIISSGLIYEVQQTGMNNQLIQKEEGATKLNYKITQIGFGMKIIITNGVIK